MEAGEEDAEIFIHAGADVQLGDRNFAGVQAHMVYSTLRVRRPDFSVECLWRTKRT
jgi:hypothetical protein